MPRNARTVAPGLPYHITQRGTNRERVFFSVADRFLYLRLLRDNVADSQVHVLAYCLMTNHVHLVVVPEREDSLAVLFARVNGRFAQAVNIRKGRSGHLWQSRFFSCALSHQHLAFALRYVEANPCRAGLASQPEDYRWSSAAAHLLDKPDRSGLLDEGFFARTGGAETWAEIHHAVDDPVQTAALRKCTYSGRPFGEESFILEMEERFHRKWRRLRTGLVEEIAVSA